MKEMLKSPVTTKVQPSPERLAVQMKFMERRYDDVLAKVLEQNALILNSIGRMQDDLKDLRTKMESLELSVQEEAATPVGSKVNGVQGGRGDVSLSTSQHMGSATPTTGYGGQTIPPAASSPFPQQPPVQPFYHPYGMYNPYMMTPLSDPMMSYLCNPAATMQYAALYGALSQNAAAAAPPPPAVSEPPKTLPPFSFGVQLPTASAPVDSLSNTSTISFAPPKVSTPKKTENGNVVTPSLAPSKIEAPVVPASVTPTRPAPQPAITPAAPAKTTVQAAVTTPKSTTTSNLVGTPAAPSKIVPAVNTAPVSSAPSSVFGAPAPTFGTASKGSIFGTPSFGTVASPAVSFGTPSTTASTFGTPVTSATSIFAPPTATATAPPKPTFTFGMTTASQDKVDGPIFSCKPAAPETPEQKKEEKPAAPTIDFAELAAKANMCSFGEIAKPDKPAENPFGSFKGFGSSFNATPVFGTVSSSTAAVASEKATSSPSSLAAREDEHEDDFVPTAEFAPVIPLPPLVEVKKGDENETALFQHRAKLLRFVKETKEWKERGVGDIKILQAKDNPRKIRVVMWRERVHKIACNHWVTKEISVANYQGNAKALMWTAIDFAEGEEPKTEIFVCRFGQEDTAKEFKKQMDYAISLVEKTPVTPQKGEEGANKEEEPKKEVAPAANVPLSQLWKKPEGTWSCSSCYSDNKKESAVCAACTAPNPNAPQVPKTEAPAAPKFTFGFGLPTTPVATTTAVSKVEEKPKETAAFTLKSGNLPAQPIFGSPAPTTNTTTTPSSTGSLFGTLNLGKDTTKESSSPAPFLDFSKLSSGMPSFGNIASVGTGGPKPFGGNAIFGSGTVQPVFGAPATTTDTSGPRTPKDGENEPEEEFVPTAEFKPVIPLPPLVEVKKGDENETVLFQNRAKLLRFVKELKEWKERGVGDIKLLQDKENPKKIRVVMWREQVHKIACNHWVAKDMEISNYQGNAKALMWTAVDFAEGADPNPEIFVCRFGQEDKAKEFKTAFQKAIDIVKNSPDTPEKPKDQPKEQAVPATQKPLSEMFKRPEGDWNCDSCYCTNNKDRTTCISCNATRAGVASTPGEGKDNSDLIEKAESLKLPSNYFTEQKDKPDHPPCRGCDPDSFDFSVLDGRKVPSFEDIPKPQREAPKQNETLKELLTKGADSSKLPSTGGIEAPKSALSSFSFSMPSSTTITTTNSSTPEFKISTPTFSFTPNFNLTPDKTSIIGSSAAFGSGSGFGTDSNVPTTVASYGDHENGDEHEEEDEDEEDEEPMFLSEGHAYFKEESGDFQDYGEGQVKVLYDGDHFCARFWFASNTDEDLYIDHIIAAETHVKPAGENTFEWGCIYYNGENSVRATVKIQFPDQQTYDQFSTAMADSVDIAMQAGVTEDDLVNGSAGDSQD